ncbi:TMEM175 family protein [Furfurilactobacillus sp. WILCCON 0119]
MEKLKTRLDSFSDDIISIIITIMVLNIHSVVSDNSAAYLVLGKEIGIYLISFFYIANMWYQHATVFNEIKTMTYRILILDFLFLASLSLIPLLTGMMAGHTTRITVMAYGVLSFIVGAFFRYLSRAIVHFRYTDKTDMAKVYVKIYGYNNRILNGLSVVTIILAYFKPAWAIILYLIYPIWNFLSNSSDRQEMYDVEQLTEAQRAEFLDFSTADRKAFREQHDKIAALAQSNIAATPVETAAPATPESAPVKTAAPQTQEQASHGDRQRHWQQWLDQNIDPEMQQKIKHGYRPTEEQRKQWAKWFKEQRHQRHNDQQHHSN